MKKVLSLALALIMMLSCTALFASAQDDSITVSVRIEGNEENLFFGDVTLTSDVEFTVENALRAADESDDSVSIAFEASYYGGYYISAVNDFYAGEFGGWDGWSFIHNGVAPSVGISYEYITDGSVIILYYGDYPTQIPYIDADDAQDGEFVLYSDDIVYDDNWNESVVTSLVTDYILTWGYGDGQTVEIAVGSDGVVSIASEYLTAGAHSVQIEKTSTTGATSVLRFAPDFTVEIQAEDEDNSFDVLSFFTSIISTIIEFYAGVFEMLFSFATGLFN